MPTACSTALHACSLGVSGSECACGSYLNLSNLSYSVRATLPKLSYPVRLLALVDCSQYFVLYGIFEYALANLLMRIEQRADTDVAAAKAEKDHKSTPLGEHAETSELPPTAHELTPDLPPTAHELHANGSSTIDAAPVDVTLTVGGAPVTSHMTQSGIKQNLSRHRVKQYFSRHHSRVASFFIDSHGSMRIRAHQLDIMSRYLYPIAYAVVLGTFFARSGHADV